MAERGAPAAGFTSMAGQVTDLSKGSTLKIAALGNVLDTF
jgi:hypothetical protein